MAQYTHINVQTVGTVEWIFFELSYHSVMSPYPHFNNQNIPRRNNFDIGQRQEFFLHTFVSLCDHEKLY